MQQKRPLILLFSTLAVISALLIAGMTWYHLRSSAAFPNGIQTAFVIVMENEKWSDVKGNTASAPYLNSLLTRTDAAYANEYYNPPNLHPSEPNYIWIEAGDASDLPNGRQTINFASDEDPSPTNSTSTQSHLVRYLQNAHISWKAYFEGIDGKSCPLVSNKKTKYAAKHNPFVFFQDVTDNNNSQSPYCMAHERPYEDLAMDLKNNTVARYNMIIPDLCHDSHDTAQCASNDSLRNGDTWLSENLPKILASDAYRKGGAVFLTWDESEDGTDGPIGMIVLSSKAKGRGYNNTIHYDHSSLLKTLLAIYGIPAQLRNTQQATDLGDLFTPPY